jgi:hypothetical protein
MRLKSLVFFVCFIFLTLFVSAYPPTKKPDQEAIARVFLKEVLHEHYDAAYKYFAKEMRKTLDVTKLEEAGKGLLKEAKLYGDSINFFMNKTIYENGHIYKGLVFKFQHDVTKGPFGLLMTVVFEDNSASKIIGFNWTMPVEVPRKLGEGVSTSSGSEERIGEPQVWKIDDQDLQVIEISLVHFAKEESILVIKVDHAFENMDLATAKKLGLPIAQEAIRREWPQIAAAKAKEMNKILLEDIGIAFIKLGLRGGYRVKITPEDLGK